MTRKEQRDRAFDAVLERDVSSAPKVRGKVLVGTVMVVSAALWIGVFVSLTPGILKGVSDFSTFYAAGKMVLTGHCSEIYDYDAQAEAQRPFVVEHRAPVMPFVVPPYTLAVFILLATLPYSLAVISWYGINLAILLALPFLLRERFELTENQLALLVISLALFFPLTISLVQGQLTPLTLLLLTLVFLYLSRGHDFRGGAILSVASYKPQFVIPLLMVLACARRGKAVGGFLCVSAVLLVASVAITGWNATLRFPEAIIAFGASSTNTSTEQSVERMINLRGLLQSLLAPHLSRTVLMVIAASASLGLVMALLAVVRGNETSELGFALVIIVTVLASYHCYKHDMGVVILALFLTAYDLRRHQLTHFRMCLALVGSVVFISPFLLPSSAIVILLLLFAVLLAVENTRHLGALESGCVGATD